MGNRAKKENKRKSLSNSAALDEAKFYRRLCSELRDERDEMMLARKSAETENAKLRELCTRLYKQVELDDDAASLIRDVIKREVGFDVSSYDGAYGTQKFADDFIAQMRELRIEVDDD